MAEHAHKMRSKFINSRDKARYISELALDKKANDVVIMDMNRSGFCDFFVIAGAESARKAKAISDHILDEMRKKKFRAMHAEGESEALWILLDFGDVVCHIMHDEKRRFYDLERLWHDSPKEYVDSTCTDSKSKKK